MSKKDKEGKGKGKIEKIVKILLGGVGIEVLVFFCNNNTKMFGLWIVSLIAIFVNIVLLFRSIIRKKKRFLKRRKKLLKKGNKKELYKEEMKTKKKIQISIRKFGGNILYVILLVIVVCIQDFDTTKVLAHDVRTFAVAGKNQLYDTNQNKTQDVEKEERVNKNIGNEDNTITLEEQKNLSENTISQEKIRRKKPETYRFILKDIKVNLKDDKEIQMVTDIDNLKDWIEINGNQKENYLEFHLIRNKSNETFSDYATKEDVFEKAIEGCQSMIYFDDWKKSAPNSTTLDEIIDGKRKLVKILRRNELENYEIWWSLANDYQKYALEYSNQTHDKEKVTYFYFKSIYCCLQALEFQNTEDTNDMIRNYMEARCKDLVLEDGITYDYRTYALQQLNSLEEKGSQASDIIENY